MEDGGRTGGEGVLECERADDERGGLGPGGGVQSMAVCKGP